MNVVMVIKEVRLTSLESFLTDFDLYLDVYERIEGKRERDLTEDLRRIGTEVGRGTRSWTKADLKTAVLWKRLRPFQMPMIEKELDAEVNERLRLAFTTHEEKLRIEVLLLIRGVGPALASTLMMFTWPDKYGVFDKHALEALRCLQYDGLPKKKPGDFKARELLAYFRTITNLAGAKGRTPRDVDKALYAWDRVRKSKKWKDAFALIREEWSTTYSQNQEGRLGGGLAI